MIDVIQSIVAFVFVLGILITFHEYGHFQVARWFDVKILRFSIGFGKPIWKKTFGPDKCEFVIASLPLGGYVKMLDEREGQVKESEKDRAFNNKPVLQRILVVIAGPAFNFMFAIFAYWLMFVVGVEDVKPYIGEVEQASIAEESGIRSGDLVLAVDGKLTPTWSSVIDTTVTNVVDARRVQFTIQRSEGDSKDVAIDLSRISIDDMASGKLFKAMGIYPKRYVIPPIMGEIIADGAAEAAGMMVGDEVVRVDGESVSGWMEWVKLVRASAGQQLQVEVLRSGSIVNLTIVPRAVDEEGERVGKIGAAVDQAFLNDKSYYAVETYPVLAAFQKAMEKTVEMSLLTLKILGKMLVGEASVKNLSGPVSIAEYAGKTAERGLTTFLSFMAIISVSLGVLNLLPIPLLDGGHLLFYLVEVVKGSPLSEAFQIAGQQFGLIVLLGLMSIALYNDILRLMG